jgi:hypothetical protein
LQVKHARKPMGKKWTKWGLNPRPHATEPLTLSGACEASALPLCHPPVQRHVPCKTYVRVERAGNDDLVLLQLAGRSTNLDRPRPSRGTNNDRTDRYSPTGSKTGSVAAPVRMLQLWREGMAFTTESPVFLWRLQIRLDIF